jgi:transcriptional antiterminator RfaH
MPYWTAHLQPGRANLALGLLKQFGYETYYPLIAGKRLKVPVGLFPGYAFIVATEHWWSANSCPGVRRLIRGNGERPAEIVDGIVDDIRRREGRDGLVKLPKPRGMQPGDRVRVVRGALEGKLAVLHANMNGHARVAVLLTMLGSERRVLLPRTNVKPIRHE